MFDLQPLRHTSTLPLSQMTMSASLPGAITPTSPARLTIAALPLVLATIASMGVMPTV